MLDTNYPPVPVDLSSREFAALERYAEQVGLTVEEAATELVKAEAARRIGPSMRLIAHVLPFRRR